MKINISDLNPQPLGADLLSGSESIMENLRVLSDEELNIAGGGGYGYGGKGKGKGKGKGSKGKGKGSKGKGKGSKGKGKGKGSKGGYGSRYHW